MYFVADVVFLVPPTYNILDAKTFYVLIFDDIFDNKNRSYTHALVRRVYIVDRYYMEEEPVSLFGQLVIICQFFFPVHFSICRNAVYHVKTNLRYYVWDILIRINSRYNVVKNIYEEHIF